MPSAIDLPIFSDLLTCRNMMWISVLSAVTSIFNPRCTEKPPCLPNTHPLYAKSNSQELIIIVTSVDHVKFSLSALERKEMRKQNRVRETFITSYFMIGTTSSPRKPIAWLKMLYFRTSVLLLDKKTSYNALTQQWYWYKPVILLNKMVNFSST